MTMTLTALLGIVLVSGVYICTPTGADNIREVLNKYDVSCTDYDVSDLTGCALEFTNISPPFSDQLEACHINCSLISALYSCLNGAQVSYQCASDAKRFVDNILGIIKDVVEYYNQEFEIPECVVQKLIDEGPIAKLCPHHEPLKIPEWTEWGLASCHLGAASFRRKCVNQANTEESRRGCDGDDQKTRAVKKCSDVSGAPGPTLTIPSIIALLTIRTFQFLL